MNCSLCDSPLSAPIYTSPLAQTSTGESAPDPVAVHACEKCGHLQTPPLPQIERYYDVSYGILTHSEDEDQIYELLDGEPVYRTAHQAATLLDQVQPESGARVLEFGAGKAATLRHLSALRPDLNLHAFDVSADYQSFWKKFLPAENWASYEIPERWHGYFDVVCSFFVFEHLTAPREALRGLVQLLRPGGKICLVVPDVDANWADFLVAEHTSHFHVASLRQLLNSGDLCIDEISTQAHKAALLASGRRAHSERDPAAPDPAAGRAIGKRLADYWGGFAQRVRDFEAAHEHRASAIYGAGFYGAHLLSCLRDPARVRCFVDSNPHLQGRSWQGVPVVAPTELAEDVNLVYAGLNPKSAAAIIAAVPGWETRSHDVFLP